MTIREVRAPIYEITTDDKANIWYVVRIGTGLPYIYCTFNDSMQISTKAPNWPGSPIEGYTITHTDFRSLDGYYYVLPDGRLGSVRQSVVLVSEGPDEQHIPYIDLVNTVITSFPQFLDKLPQREESVETEIVDHLNRLRISTENAPTLLKHLQKKSGQNLEMKDLMNFVFRRDFILKFFRGKHDAIFTYDGIDYVRINDFTIWWSVDFRYKEYECKTFRDGNGYILSPKREFIFFGINDHGEIDDKLSVSAAFNYLIEKIDQLQLCSSIDDLKQLNLSREEYKILASLRVFNFKKKVLNKREFNNLVTHLILLKSTPSDSSKFRKLVAALLRRIYEQPPIEGDLEFFSNAQEIRIDYEFYSCFNKGIEYLRIFQPSSLRYSQIPDLRRYYEYLVFGRS